MFHIKMTNRRVTKLLKMVTSGGRWCDLGEGEDVFFLVTILRYPLNLYEHKFYNLNKRSKKFNCI